MRHITRSFFTASGTMLGVAAVVTIVGLSQSAQNSVSSSFNEQVATQVTFQDGNSGGTTNLIAPNSASLIRRLCGVEDAGYISPINGGQPLTVSSRPLNGDGFAVSSQLPVTFASPSALSTMQVRMAQGRSFDAGMVRRGANVAVIGQSAANQLDISTVANGPTIFIQSVPFTVVGIANYASQQSQALLGIIVPPSTTDGFAKSSGPPTLIVRTAIGAAQLIGQEGAQELSPSNPSQIVADVPPNPTTLRQQVESSVSALLLTLGLISLVIGLVSITNVTLLSVLERRSEFGLRRALGARRFHIAALVLVEASIVGFLGGMIGTSLGILLTCLIAIAKGWTPIIDWPIVIIAPVIGLSAGIIAGLYPSVRASRTEVVASLQGN
jgi:putative ABC transport system permease protein